MDERVTRELEKNRENYNWKSHLINYQQSGIPLVDCRAEERR
jgi:hypothetical protein